MGQLPPPPRYCTFSGASKVCPHQQVPAVPMDLDPWTQGWLLLSGRMLEPGSLHRKDLSMLRLLSNEMP